MAETKKSPEKIFIKAKKIQEASEPKNKKGLVKTIQNFLGIDRDNLKDNEKLYTEKILKKYKDIRQASMEAFDYPFLYYWLGEDCAQNDKKCETAVTSCREKKKKKSLGDDCLQNPLGDVQKYCFSNKCKRHEDFFTKVFQGYGSNFRPFYLLSREKRERDEKLKEEIKAKKSPFIITLNRSTPGAFDVFYMEGNTPTKSKISGALSSDVLLKQIKNKVKTEPVQPPPLPKKFQQKVQQKVQPQAPPALPPNPKTTQVTTVVAKKNLPSQAVAKKIEVAQKQTAQTKQILPKKALPLIPCSDDDIIKLIEKDKLSTLEFFQPSNCQITSSQQKYLNAMQILIKELEKEQSQVLEKIKVNEKDQKCLALLEQNKQLEDLKNKLIGINRILIEKLNKLKLDCQNCKNIEEEIIPTAPPQPKSKSPPNTTATKQKKVNTKVNNQNQIADTEKQDFQDEIVKGLNNKFRNVEFRNVEEGEEDEEWK